MNRAWRAVGVPGVWLAVILGLGVVAVVLTFRPAPAKAESVTAAQVVAFASTTVALRQEVEDDHAKITGPDACGECHAAELEAWKHSTHFKTFKTMHKLKGEDNEFRARKIVEALGLKGSIKRNDLCYTCHYTSQIVNGRRKSISGVSCESCHGPGKDWTSPELHHEKAKDAQTTELRESILKDCEQVGMLRPKNIYLVATNCYTCHTVPNEKLVNVGGHPAGSCDFELVSWSQGEVRHNYQYSPDKKNREASPERKRVLYVVGTLTDLEYSLRGLSKATEKGTYRTAMYRRVNRALRRLDLMLPRKCITEVAQALTVVPRIEQHENPDHIGKLTTDASMFPKLGEVADKVAEAAQRFVANHDGSGLAALDTLIPGPDQYKGEAQP